MLPPGKRYVECFAGRANVYFAVAQLLGFEQFWLNDLQTFDFLNNLSLPFTWEVPENSRQSYEHYKAHKAQTKLMQRILASHGKDAPVFSPSIVFEPWLCYSGGTYYNGSRGKAAGRLNSKGFARRVRLATEIMQRTKPRITQLHYRDVLPECGEGDVVYLDPPYIGCDVDVYSDKTIDPAEIVALLKRAKFKWILSEYEQPIYIKAFGEPIRIDVQKLLGPKGAANARATECLWKNF